jgi:hypothetical protein
MRILVVWSSALGVIQINPTFEEVQARKSSGWAEGWLYSRKEGVGLGNTFFGPPKLPSAEQRMQVHQAG